MGCDQTFAQEVALLQVEVEKGTSWKEIVKVTEPEINTVPMEKKMCVL